MKLLLQFALLLSGLVMCVPARANISKTGSCSAATTACTLSAVHTGDVKIMYATRNGSTTAPSLPATYTNIANGSVGSSGTSSSYRIYCSVASSGSDTGTGTATNATDIAAVALSGTSVPDTTNCATTLGGRLASSSAGSTTMSYGGITMRVNNGTSWVLGFGMDASVAACAPSGLSQFELIGSGPSSIGTATTSGVSSWSTTTCAVSSSRWLTYVIEAQAGCFNLTLGSFVCKQAGQGTFTSGTTNTITLPATATAGDQVLISSFNCSNTTCTSDPSSLTLTFTDGAGDSVSLPSTPCSTQLSFFRLCGAIIPNVSATSTFTATFTGGTGWFLQWYAVEVSGGATASPFDGDIAYNANAAATSLSMSYTSSTDIFNFGYLNGDVGTNFVVGSGFSDISQIATALPVEGRAIAAGTSNCSWTWTTSAKVEGMCMGLKKATGGTTTPTQVGGFLVGP